ncbi:MAG TPA: Gfo/Idh/MocA family oxidoreductase [Candidatus Saccharimonadales bacterium]|nr:Gfo/Idh/MocA family oxidoreductase [Candidatus Saccharimonadales bacterium]
MTTSISRRAFARRGLAAAATVSTVSFPFIARAGASPGERVRLGVMGTNGRGSELIRGFSSLGGAEIAYVCDVDSRAIGKGVKAVNAEKQSQEPKGVKDFRRILEDRNVDALVVAAPDHWHGPATILACAAGKHVYVEKPACHNPQEGEWMVAASRKHRRVVQLGTQRRSYPGIREGIEHLRQGLLGRVLFVRGWYNNTRASIGVGKPAPVPSWLDFDLWQGPAPDRPYKDNIIHYNWHWFWHWGTGELGNNGIHSLDVCRWGLGVDYPLHVTCGGGKYRFEDDQETPDTQVVTFDFGGKSIVWEGRSWHPRGFEGSGFGAAFYGERGTMIMDGGTYKVFDFNGKEMAQQQAKGGDSLHYQNFLDAIRADRRPNADIEDGYKSTLLCHLGNIAWRTGRALKLDAQTHGIVGDPEAAALWSREYRPGWTPQV